jgi:hypothetical protein
MVRRKNLQLLLEWSGIVGGAGISKQEAEGGGGGRSLRRPIAMAVCVRNEEERRREEMGWVVAMAKPQQWTGRIDCLGTDEPVEIEK